MTLFAYLVVGFVALAGLAWMIRAIATEAARCAVNGAAARAAGVTIVTGFLAIGGGVVLIIAVLPLSGPNPAMAVFAMGLVSLILGLGFTQAITTLRVAALGPQGRAVQTVASGAAQTVASGAAQTVASGGDI